MLLFFIFIHFLLSLKVYFSERIYGLKSIYVIGTIIFIFIPTLYRSLDLMYVDYSISWYFHFTSFLCTVIIMTIKPDYYKISGLLNIIFKSNIINRIYSTLILSFIIMILLSFIGLSYELRFPAVGLFCVVTYFASYLYYNKDNYGYLWLRFLILSLLLFLFFSFYLWSGYGRLILFQFVSISFFFYSCIIKNPKKLKFIFLISIPLMIAAGGILRSNTATISSAITDGDGTGSVFSTYRESERVIRDINNGKINKLYGDSYTAAFLFFVPRSLWHDKPVGFGKQLVDWYEPWLYSTGHSLAGTFIAEAFANFGLFAVFFAPILLLVLISIFVKILNSKKNSLNYKDISTGLITVCYFSLLPEFIWGGAQTYLIRSTVAAFMIFLIFKTFNLLGLFNKYD